LSHQHVKFRVRVNQNHDKAISSLITPKIKILFQQIVGIYHMKLLLEQISSNAYKNILWVFGTLSRFDHVIYLCLDEANLI
jgi:hypothetical protein